MGTECDCNRQRGKYGCRISVVSGRIPLLLGRKKKKMSIGGPWKSVVKANIQHPCRDFYAIIFIGKSTGAIESVAWKMVWCLGGDGEEGDAYPSPIAGDGELHFCIHGQRTSPAAVLWLRKEECFPVSSARSLSQSICETWELL